MVGTGGCMVRIGFTYRVAFEQIFKGDEVKRKIIIRMVRPISLE